MAVAVVGKNPRDPQVLTGFDRFSRIFTGYQRFHVNSMVDVKVVLAYTSQIEQQRNREVILLIGHSDSLLLIDLLDEIDSIAETYYDNLLLIGRKIRKKSFLL
jgi:hypothetical protein